jgi:L-lactate dehydrogenase complex protein LldG
VVETLAALLAVHRSTSVVVPSDFPDHWRPARPGTVIADDRTLSIDALNSTDTVLTLCKVAIAETGTVVLDGGPGQGRRAVTLLPDHHIVIVKAEQIVANVPDALSVIDRTAPQTWISGPSATSDIELQRVEGVHGPRVLDVVIVTGG